MGKGHKHPKLPRTVPHSHGGKAGRNMHGKPGYEARKARADARNKNIEDMDPDYRPLLFKENKERYDRERLSR